VHSLHGVSRKVEALPQHGTRQRVVTSHDRERLVEGGDQLPGGLWIPLGQSTIQKRDTLWVRAQLTTVYCAMDLRDRRVAECYRPRRLICMHGVDRARCQSSDLVTRTNGYEPYRRSVDGRVLEESPEQRRGVVPGNTATRFPAKSDGVVISDVRRVTTGSKGSSGEIVLAAVMANLLGSRDARANAGTALTSTT
jgi:hypothetical protein